MRNQLLIPLLLVTATVQLVAEDTPIVHPSVAAGTVSRDDLKEFFLGKKTVWDDGSKVVVVVAKDGPGLMALLGKSSQQYQTSWKKLVFTGKGVMPEQVENDDAVVAFVAQTPGAIGYVDASKLKDGVKAVALK